MWRITVFKIVTLVLISRGVSGKEDNSNEFGTNLVAELRNDANLDLPVDEEYEDLRAELLAYRTTLAKLSDDSARKSMMTTPCWQMGGICINYKLCREQHGRYLTQALGCRDKLNVCCFAWNQFKVKDMREHGINGPFPWSIHYEAGDPSVVNNDRNSIKNRIVLKIKKDKKMRGNRIRDRVKERNKKEIKKDKSKNTKDNKKNGKKNKNKNKKRRKKDRKEKDKNKERKEGDTNDHNKKRDSTTEKNNSETEEEENIVEDSKINSENEEIFPDENNNDSDKGENITDANRNKSEKRDNRNKDEKPDDRQSDNKEVENKKDFEDHTESDYYTYEDEEDNNKQKKKKTIARKQLSVKFPTFVVDTDDDTDKTLKSIILRIPITKNLRKNLNELKVNDKVISRNNAYKQNDNIDQRSIEILAFILKTV